MPSIRCTCVKEQKSNDGIQQICCCEWEIKFGYGVAMSLVVFETKRLLIIVFELLIQWHVVRILGGLQPIILTFIDIFLGFFTALAIIFTLRGQKSQFWYPSTQRSLKGLLILIFICLIMNISTLGSICYNVTVRESTISNVFNTSMHNYAIDEWDKLNVDQIQLDQQCCGHTNYSDWFGLDWQITQDTPKQNRVGKIDEWDIPFSCCNIESLGPCIHTHMKEEDIHTINNQGCSSSLHQIILKIILVAYAMGVMLIFTRIFVAVCIVRMLTTSFMDFSRCGPRISQHSLLLSGYREITEKYSRLSKGRPAGNRSKRIQLCMRPRLCRNKRGYRNHHSESSLDFSSDLQTARITPSVHSEHRIPQTLSPTMSTSR